jgi:hypothetical protein
MARKQSLEVAPAPVEKITLSDVEALIPGLLQTATFLARLTRTAKDDMIVAKLKELYGDGTLVKVLLRAINGK